MAIALVEKGLGITVLPGLTLIDLIPNRAVKIIPLKDRLTRTVSLLCPRESERSHLTEVFLRLTQQRVEHGERHKRTKPLNHWFKGFFMGKTCERQGKLLGNDRKLDENGENGLPFLSSFRYNKKGYISKQQGGLRLTAVKNGTFQ